MAEPMPAERAFKARKVASAAAVAGAYLVRRMIRSVEYGSLTLELPSGEAVELRGSQPGTVGHVRIHRWRALRRLLVAGDTGLAESYRDGDWTSDDLKGLLLWGIANQRRPGAVSEGWSIARSVQALRHWRRTNTRHNSRRNIAAHYDLGNAFYEAWLDQGMQYSSAIYSHETSTLEAAQSAKLDRIVDLLELKGGEQVLEIGCGWGALAERLAAEQECRVLGITLSQEQLDYVREFRNLSGRGDIRLEDYRDVVGKFDRIASIEMLEAVGEAYWPTYFSKLHDCLEPAGIAVLQAITIDETRYESYRSRPDFIQAHIFPGGMLPTQQIIAEQARQAALVLQRVECFGESYARTLDEWRSRFHRSWPKLSALGFDDRFRRLWEYYLTYCEAGFEAGWLDVGLYQLRRLP
jgi:cyclopropane-fatty-acyl-phospholipid synthase